MKELLDLPRCPVRKCSQCGCEVGWSWVSRDWGCSECATTEVLSTKLCGAMQEVSRLRAALQEIADMYPDGPCACGLAREALITTSAPPENS